MDRTKHYAAAIADAVIEADTDADLYVEWFVLGRDGEVVGFYRWGEGPQRFTEATAAELALLATATGFGRDELGYCAWCDEADAPAYRDHEGHDPECPFGPRPDPAPVVVCVRDPDSANFFTTYACPPALRIVDLDLGGHDLAAPDEFVPWAAGHLATADELADTPGASADILGVVDQQRARYHHERWPDLSTVRAACVVAGLL